MNLAIMMLFLCLFSNPIMGQKKGYFGQGQPMLLGGNTPYARVSVNGCEGYFLVDFGTTTSTIDPNNFINGTPLLVDNSVNKFADFRFLGNWGAVHLNVQNHSNILGLDGFKQAGILGTDFLANNIYTLDYENKKIYKSSKATFYSSQQLHNMGFQAVSSRGYYASQKQELQNLCTPNIPTIPVSIGDIDAVAQIDSGYNDTLFEYSININTAFFEALEEAGIHLIPNPAANLILSTCNVGYNEVVKAYRLPKGVSFSVAATNGKRVLVNSNINVFVKQTSNASFHCGGIGTWKIPAAQMGASFLKQCKQVIFDPFNSKVWFRE